MPLFDFQCRCGHLFEEFVPVKQKAKQCPLCHKLARRVPFPRRLCLRTETQYAATYGTLLDQYDGNEGYVNALCEAAERQGYRPNASDVHQPGLADSFGDPQSFLPADQVKSRTKALCAQRGVGSEGRIEIPTPEPTEPPSKPVKMAADLVETKRRNMIRQDPGLAAKDQNDLREAIISKHGWPDD